MFAILLFILFSSLFTELAATNQGGTPTMPVDENTGLVGATMIMMLRVLAGRMFSGL